MTREQAATDVARRLSRMGYSHPSGKEIKPAHIADWGEKMMTELASENRAVARYQAALDWVKDKGTASRGYVLIGCITWSFSSQKS
jgi:hypothetical protein